jgi:lipopolysaccharide/colanic/teichoic acid biosynthesis glycosyltransferase
MTAQPIRHKRSTDAAIADFLRPHWKHSMLALRESLIRRLDAAAITDARALSEQPSALAPTPAFDRSTQRILSAQEFRSLLDRERELANRGTRCFSLIALRPASGTPRGFERLGREVRERLRSTDLVGRASSNRFELLLADTGPVGACVVADWIDRLATEIGIQVEPRLFVYPSLCEAQHRDHEDRGGDGNGHSSSNGNGHAHLDGNGRSNGHSHPRMQSVRGWDAGETRARRTSADRSAVRGRASIDPGLRSPQWPVEDLWRHLAVETPLLKRCIDVVVASIALVLLLPVLAIVAAAIRLDSPGPVIFRQKRAGRGGHPFVFYKFRSMFVDAEKRRAELQSLNEQSGPIFKIKNDPRMTRVGRLLRRWSIDELPQLWNVIKGDLSLVGPRSPTFEEFSCYERWERQRLCVTGGITCIWQVSGRSQISFRDWMRMDMRYLARRGLWLDLCLLARTVPAVVSGRGAY